MLHMDPRQHVQSVAERRSVPCGTKPRHSRRKFYCCLRADSDSDARESPEKKPPVAAAGVGVALGRPAPAQACDVDWQPLSPRMLSSSPDRSGGFRTERRVMEGGDAVETARCTIDTDTDTDCALARTLADTTLETSLDTVQWHTPTDDQASGCPFSRLTREHTVSPQGGELDVKRAGEGDALPAGVTRPPPPANERKTSRSELLPSDATRRVSSESGLGPDLRRTSSESDSEPRKVSSDSWGDVDASSGRKPLNLASLVEGVGALIMPSQNFMTLALRRLLTSWGPEKWEAISEWVEIKIPNVPLRCKKCKNRFDLVCLVFNSRNGNGSLELDVNGHKRLPEKRPNLPLAAAFDVTGHECLTLLNKASGTSEQMDGEPLSAQRPGFAPGLDTAGKESHRHFGWGREAGGPVYGGAYCVKPLHVKRTHHTYRG
ncbi:Guanylate cyclase soluble subunit alpha-1, partial [Branchiostoma belcheri]